ANNNASFTKKATGRINFICNEGQKVDAAIKKTIETGEGQTIWMNSIGTNEEGVEVSNFNFEWTIKVRS
ncbi:MAG: thioesterase, partial [Gelidibacter sp.]